MRTRILRVTIHLFILVGAVSLLSCSSTGGPSADEQEKSFSNGLPVFLSLQSFEIKSSEKSGTEDDPVFKNRFHARIELNADTYAIVDEDIDTVIVQKKAKQGDMVEVLGISECKRQQGDWQIACEVEGGALQTLGVPMDSLAGSIARIIIDGTEEARLYRSEKAKRLQAEKKARRATEPDHVIVQHILIGFRGTVSNKRITRTKEQAQVLANGILQRALEGEDFDSLVEAYTDDKYPGIYMIANSGVPQDRLKHEERRSKMVRAFGDVSFSLKEGEIGMAAYDPVKSPFGWHIIKRLADTDERAGGDTHTH